MKDTEPLQETPAAFVILDLNTRHSHGVEWMRKLKNLRPSAKWLVCSLRDNEMLFRALRKGGKAYFMQDNSPAAFRNMLNEIVHEGGPGPFSTVRESIGSVPRLLPKTKNRNRLLSGREREILHFISRGLLYKEIGQQLGIQKDTVKKHLAKIYEKLEVQNKIEALNKFYGLMYRQ